MLWFDEELGSKTTFATAKAIADRLWFDEELGSKTTLLSSSIAAAVLWFDEELGSKTTTWLLTAILPGCGLMKNWDLRQPYPLYSANGMGCGLMKNWDLRQLRNIIVVVAAVVV